MIIIMIIIIVIITGKSMTEGAKKYPLEKQAMRRVKFDVVSSKKPWEFAVGLNLACKISPFSLSRNYGEFERFQSDSFILSVFLIPSSSVKMRSSCCAQSL
jgi:hypothetical protein